jgi:gas vesicle protein
MAEFEMNQLLEEAAQGCNQLVQDAADTEAAARAVEEQAHKVAETVEPEGEESHREFQELGTKLEEAEARLGSLGDAAKERLDALATRSAEAQRLVGEVLGRIRTGLGALKARKDEMASTVESRAGDIEGQLAAVAEAVETLEEETSTRLEAAGAKVDELKTALDTLQGEFEEKTEALTRATGELTTLALEKTQEYGEAVEALLTTQHDELSELAEKFVDAHNEAVMAVGRKFAEEAVARLDAGLAPVKAAMENLAELCESEDGELGTKCGAIQARADELISLLERVEPLFAAAGRLA